MSITNPASENGGGGGEVGEQEATFMLIAKESSVYVCVCERERGGEGEGLPGSSCSEFSSNFCSFMQRKPYLLRNL